MRRSDLGVAAVIGALGVAAASLGWLRCPLAALYHIPCPGCGMTRALGLLLRGHVLDSLRMNALAVPVTAATGALVLAALAPSRPGNHGGPRLRAAFAAMVVTYGAAVALWALRWFGLFGGPVPV